MSARPEWDEYFLRIMLAVGERGTCDRGKSGCVIVKDKRILTTGYAGAPSGLPHCDDVGHLMHKVTYENGETKEHCMRTTHSEQNAMIQAAKHGISLEGATVYTKFTPCINCAKMIINAGVKRVVSLRDYQASEKTKEFFAQAGIALDIINKEVESY
jgi:dCMP deaminase